MVPQFYFVTKIFIIVGPQVNFLTLGDHLLGKKGQRENKRKTLNSGYYVLPVIPKNSACPSLVPLLKLNFSLVQNEITYYLSYAKQEL